MIMKRVESKLGLLCVLAVTALLGGCAAEGGESDTTSVSMMLTARAPIDGESDGSADDPAPPGSIRTAVVTITGIYLQGGDASDNDDADDGGRVWLSQEAQTTSLLTLSTDFPELVSDAIVQSGSYEQVRMVISGGYLEVVEEDGTLAIYASSEDYEGLPAGATVAGELQMPSLDTSGLKINVDSGAFEIEGEQKIVLLDFDIAESFGHVAGNSGAWVMHPVVNAIDVMFTSTLEVEVKLADGVVWPDGADWSNLEVRLEDADNTYVTGSLEPVEGEATYQTTFEFVNPLDNPYQIRLESHLDLDVQCEPAVPFTVEVGSGEVEVLVFTIVGVSLPVID
jgi:extradiol dioxygenase family protein